MIVLVGFRNIYLGMNDTSEVYLPMYNNLAELTFSEAYKYLIGRDYEIGFYLLTKIFIMIIDNFRLYLIILSLPINILVTRLIYKKSKIPFLSFLIYFSLNYFAISFTGLRHCVALSILLIAYEFIEKKNVKVFVLMVLFASLFHKTALIFLIAYPLANLKINHKNFLIIFSSLGFSIIFGKKFLDSIINLLGITRYQMYLDASGDTLTFFFINLLLIIFVIYILPKVEKDNMKQMINMYTIGISIASATVFIAEAFRMSTYYTIYSMILIPNAIASIKNKKIIPVLLYIFSVLLIIYFFLFSMKNNNIYPYTMQFTI